MSKDNYYEMLGLSKGCSQDDIKKSYRKLARKYHPDINPNNKEAEEKFKKISEAYAVLSDEEKRKQYDAVGHDAFTSSGQGYDYSNMNFEDFKNNFHYGDLNLDDLLGDMFGKKHGHGRRSGKLDGEDINYSVEVPFNTAVNGGEYELQLNRKELCSTCSGKGGEKIICKSCGGSGRANSKGGNMFGVFAECNVCRGTGEITVNTCSKCSGRGSIAVSERVRVKIPAGVDNDSKIRLAGKGNAGRNGGKTGDLNIIIKVAPHPIFERKGDNIYVNVDVDMFEAALGEKITIPTPYGEVNMNIPAGVQPKQQFRIKGKGIPHMKGGGVGDLYIVVNVKIPQIVQEEDRLKLNDIRGRYHLCDRGTLLKKGKL